LQNNLDVILGKLVWHENQEVGPLTFIWGLGWGRGGIEGWQKVRDACFLLFVMGPIGCSWMGLFGFSWREGGHMGESPQVRGDKRKGKLDFCIIVVCGGEKRKRKNLNMRL
jgi:hypothetical protein